MDSASNCNFDRLVLAKYGTLILFIRVSSPNTFFSISKGACAPFDWLIAPKLTYIFSAIRMCKA